MAKLKIGMLGASKIVDRAIIEPSGELNDIIPYGIAARNVEKAKGFANERNIQKTFQSYGELVSSDEIDAVYISTVP